MAGSVYFDNAATTFPKPEEVYRFMDTFYRECGVNVGRGQHKLASRATALVTETRKLLLDLNHCPSKQVVFTPSATEALNIILQGIGIAEGWNVYVSPFEHNAVMRVLHHTGQAVSINVQTLAVKSMEYDLAAINEQFAGRKPHLVVVSHASNVCGLVAPIHEIFSLSKKHGAINVVDMAQTMGLIDTDLSTSSIDYAVFAGHKTLYGPLGVGGFICAPDARPRPLLYGGTGIDSANPDLPEFLPDRYEVGSPNILAIAGLHAALGWIRDTGFTNILVREQENSERLVKTLVSHSNIRIVGGNTHACVQTCGNEKSRLSRLPKVAITSAIFDGYSPEEIGGILSERGICVRTGLHCAPLAHKHLATFPAGTVRFAPSYFSSEADFAALELSLMFIDQNS